MSNGLDLLGPPITVADAVRDHRDARTRLDRYARDYARARNTTHAATVARARAEWGLAIYEWVQATTGLAAAEDRERATRHGIPAPEPGAPPAEPDIQRESDQTDPDDGITIAQAKEHQAVARARADTCWAAYDNIRRTADQAATDPARSAWEQALATWMHATITYEEKKDEGAIAARQQRQDSASQFHPADAFPRNRTRTQQIAHNSREHTRRINLDRDRRRYERP